MLLIYISDREKDEQTQRHIQTVRQIDADRTDHSTHVCHTWTW